MIKELSKKIFDYFIFSRVYISFIAVVMVMETQILFLHPSSIEKWFLVFIFFSTLSSYNFHWYLSPLRFSDSHRQRWSMENKKLHLALSIFSAIISLLLLAIFFREELWLILVPVILTFLYSASKIPYKIFSYLKFIASIKTIILALVWTYTTIILPMLLVNYSFNSSAILYIISKFLFLFSICILFDYRDRKVDEQEGTKNMISYFSNKNINRLFTSSLIVSVFLFYFLMNNIRLLHLLFLFIPNFSLATLYQKAKKDFSDFFYYVVLDGLMMLSGLLVTIYQYF